MVDFMSSLSSGEYSSGFTSTDSKGVSERFRPVPVIRKIKPEASEKNCTSHRRSVAPNQRVSSPLAPAFSDIPVWELRRLLFDAQPAYPSEHVAGDDSPARGLTHGILDSADVDLGPLLKGPIPWSGD